MYHRRAGWDFRHLIESRIAQQPHGEVAPLGHAPVFGGDLCFDRFDVRRVRGTGVSFRSERGRPPQTSLEETLVDRLRFRRSHS